MATGTDDVRAVLANERRWAVVASDAMEFIHSLPTRSVSLVLTSPPYEDARTYGVGFRLRGQAWVDWMAPIIREACRASNGLVLLNAAGRVRDHQYQPVMEWLVADLTRKHGVVCGPAPLCYFRHGVPGSGRDHYHRRDWEPVYAFAFPSRLPLAWSDNTAMGRAPRWAPGGDMSHRLTDGTRVNQWGGHEKSGRGRTQHGRQEPGRPSHRLVVPNGKKRRVPKHTTSDRDGNIVTNDRDYIPPTIANPGNVVCEMYSAEDVRQILCGGEPDGRVAQGSGGGDVVRCLVGGGHMGHKRAHDSEAPFSEVLCEFAIRSFAKPNSPVCDPFLGSGTTAAVAVRWGRRFVGSDLRQSQVNIAVGRVQDETLPLPGMEG